MKKFSEIVAVLLLYAHKRQEKEENLYTYHMHSNCWIKIHLNFNTVKLSKVTVQTLLSLWIYYIPPITVLVQIKE